jgi:hypothetical protein
MTTKAITKEKKKKKAENGKKPQTKKSKFVLAWEKMEPNSLEIIDMRAVLK